MASVKCGATMVGIVGFGAAWGACACAWTREAVPFCKRVWQSTIF